MRKDAGRGGDTCVCTLCGVPIRASAGRLNAQDRLLGLLAALLLEGMRRFDEGIGP